MDMDSVVPPPAAAYPEQASLKIHADVLQPHLSLLDRADPGSSHDGFRIALAGQIDIERRAELAGLAHDFESTGCRDVVVDVAAVSFMDSTGLGLLVRLHRTAALRNGTLTVTGAAPNVVRLLSVTGMGAICSLTPTRGAAHPLTTG